MASPWYAPTGSDFYGAVTWGNGVQGTSGVISTTNSLMGTTANDQVGYDIVVLANSNYVVISPYWSNGSTAGVGTITWGSGTRPLTGTVSAANSLIGSTAGDLLVSGGFVVSPQRNELDVMLIPGVTALANGNYVINSPGWDNGALVDAGAATWANGTTGLTGTVTIANSLVGGCANNRVGSRGSLALTNDNNVVSSPDWDTGIPIRRRCASMDRRSTPRPR